MVVDYYSKMKYVEYSNCKLSNDWGMEQSVNGVQIGYLKTNCFFTL